MLHNYLSIEFDPFGPVFAPIAARIGQGLSKLYWGVRGEEAATNAALKAELRAALEADFKLYTGRVPAISVGPNKFGEVYAKAPAAKLEIDSMADEIAQMYGGQVAKHPSNIKNGQSRKS